MRVVSFPFLLEYRLHGQLCYLCLIHSGRAIYVFAWNCLSFINKCVWEFLLSQRISWFFVHKICKLLINFLLSYKLISVYILIQRCQSYRVLLTVFTTSFVFIVLLDSLFNWSWVVILEKVLISSTITLSTTLIENAFSLFNPRTWGQHWHVDHSDFMRIFLSLFQVERFKFISDLLSSDLISICGSQSKVIWSAFPID